MESSVKSFFYAVIYDRSRLVLLMESSLILPLYLRLHSVFCFVFLSEDDQYWVFREADVLPGYPQPLYEYGRGLPMHKIDTALWWEPSGNTYFFTGDRYGSEHPNPSINTSFVGCEDV